MFPLSFLFSPSFVYDLYFSFSLHSSFSVLELIAGWTAEQGCLCFSHQTLDTGSVYVWGEDGPDDFQTTPLSTNYRRQEMSSAALDLISRNVLRDVVKCFFKHYLSSFFNIQSCHTIIYALFLQSVLALSCMLFPLDSSALFLAFYRQALLKCRPTLSSPVGF